MALHASRPLWVLRRLPPSIIIMAAAAFVIGVHLGYERGVGQSLAEVEGAVAAAADGGRSVADHSASILSRPLSTTELLGRFDAARVRVSRTLKAEYGRYYGLIFDGTLINGRIFASTDESRGRLRRRMAIKIVKAQIAVEQAEEEAGREWRKDGGTVAAVSVGTDFVWATAGDSFAAGHGNAGPHSSYTSVMEDTVRDALGSVGVSFVARNHAMVLDDDGGAAASKPQEVELSLCMEAMYGPDIDVLVSDFARTDGPTRAGSGSRLAALWGDRAAVHPSRPILMMMARRGGDSERWARLSSLDGKGTGTVLMDDDALDGLLTPRLPGAEDASVNHDALPPTLRNYVCGGWREGTGPCDDAGRRFVCELPGGEACVAEKFDLDPACADPRLQTTWNRGWKEHRLRGRLLGAYLLEVTNEALLELDALRHPRWTKGGERKKKKKQQEVEEKEVPFEDILALLENREEVDKFLFESSPPSFDAWDADSDTLAEITPWSLFRKTGMCRTALLPSHQRLMGIGGGTSADAFAASGAGGNSTDEGLRIVFNPSEMRGCEGVRADRRDFYQVANGAGWRGMYIPSDGEAAAFRDAGQSLEGMIVVCFTSFSAEEDLRSLQGLDSVKLAHGNIVVEVNGAPVVGSKEIGGCHWLEGEKGLRWDKSVGNQFHVRFRVDEPGGFIRITSIAVF